MTTTETKTTDNVTTLRKASKAESIDNGTLNAKGRSTKGANFDGTQSRIVDAIVLADRDTLNALQSAIVYFANAKDATGRHLYNLANLSNVFRKHETETHTVLDDIVASSVKFGELVKRKVDAEGEYSRRKTEENKAAVTEANNRIKAVRTNVGRALAAVLYFRSEKVTTDIRINSKGAIQIIKGNGDADTGSATVFMKTGQEYIAKNVSAQRGNGNKRKSGSAAITGSHAVVMALQSLIARAEVMTANKAMLQSVPEEGALWVRLYLALAENMRYEKSDGGANVQRAASILIEPSTVKALRDFANTAKIATKPDAGQHGTSKIAAEGSKTKRPRTSRGK